MRKKDRNKLKDISRKVEKNEECRKNERKKIIKKES